jgi:hypothetical protein
LATFAQAVLRALHRSVQGAGLAVDGVPDFGAQVPCAQLVGRRLRDATWPLLRLVLLHGRVLLVAKSAARASAATWGLASLLPGAIAAGLGHHRAASDAPRFRWQRFGLPLQLFSDGDGGSSSSSSSSRSRSDSSSSDSGRGFVCLAPLVPMADAVRVFGHSSYLAGTANQMVRRKTGTPHETNRPLLFCAPLF